MKISDFISNFSNYPILFLGSGFSLRYLTHSYNWSDLLLNASKFITGNDRFFLKSKNSHTVGGVSSLKDVASDIENLFEDKLDDMKGEKYDELNDQYYELLRSNKEVSRLKIYISHLLSDISRKHDSENEFQAFIRSSKNISSIITTNYDELIEDTIRFTPYVGNDILMSNPYGAVYKVHGSVTNPASIIITNEDYSLFKEKYELIKAQLISLFIHNPIIFIGYRLQDPDINGLLNTIFKYVDYNSEISEKIRRRFLVVEYQAGSNNEEVQELDMLIGSQNVKINKLQTDNFLPIYNAIESLVLPVSAMDIQRLRNVVTDIYEGTSGIKVQIFQDVNFLKNSDKVLAIGSKWQIKYANLTPNDFIKDYFNIIEDPNESRKIEVIDQLNILKTQFFPIFGFCTINTELRSAEHLKEIERQKIKSLVEKVNKRDKYHNSHHSIKEIIEDDNIAPSNKIGNIQYGTLKKQIGLDDLKEALIHKDGYNGTDYNSLLVIYDYMTYSGEL